MLHLRHGEQTPGVSQADCKVDHTANSLQITLEIQVCYLPVRRAHHVVSRNATAPPGLSLISTLSMLVGAVLCTVQAVKNIGSPVFTNMVVSLVTTYGVFIVSSILAMDPW